MKDSKGLRINIEWEIMGMRLGINSGLANLGLMPYWRSF